MKKMALFILFALGNLSMAVAAGDGPGNSDMNTLSAAVTAKYKELASKGEIVPEPMIGQHKTSGLSNGGCLNLSVRQSEKLVEDNDWATVEFEVGDLDNKELSELFHNIRHRNNWITKILSGNYILCSINDGGDAGDTSFIDRSVLISKEDISQGKIVIQKENIETFSGFDG